MALSFAVTWDYRCPFARIVHEHVLAGLDAGADWDVRFVPFSLDQSHVEEGAPAVWTTPERYPALLANEVGIAVRDRWPDTFSAVHRAIFTARHEQARDTRQREVLAEILTETGLDPAAVLAEIDDGWPLEVFHKEHDAAAADHAVWGVPTFIAGGQAAFVRLMERPNGDAALAVASVERIVEMLTGWPALNEFKHTTVGG